MMSIDLSARGIRPLDVSKLLSAMDRMIYQPQPVMYMDTRFFLRIVRANRRYEERNTPAGRYYFKALRRTPSKHARARKRF